MGATLQCTFGMAPSTLVVPEQVKVLGKGTPIATSMSKNPMANIPPFGMCNSLANPVVASATSAASGVLTPMPCIPVIAAPWAPPVPTVLIGGQPAMNAMSKCMCNWGGVISVTNPGSATTVTL